MIGLQLAVLLGVLLLAGGLLAVRLKVPAPLVLLVLGVAVGFVPAFGDVELPPDIVLLLFLPALLYWESINTSAREIRRNIRVILLSAIPLVLVTVAAVAVLGLGAGLPLAVAITLGAIVGPTDATAVGAVAGPLPRRTSITLRAESLINDGTALTVYAVAIAAVESGRPLDPGAGSLRFLAAYAGGILIGVAIAFLVRAVRRVVRGNPLLENTVSLLTPFAAYLPAEQLEVSGVLAVVTAGLVLSRFAPRLVSAQTRTQVTGFWTITTWVLNGSLFLLVGFQAHAALEGLGGSPLRVLGLALSTTLAVIGVRVLWVATMPYVIRALDRRPVQRTLRVPIRQRTVSMWAGFRGAVSLAAALALPPEFPFRNELVAVTLVVILVTLLVQGLTLPAVVRWARLPADPTEADEERRASRAAVEAGIQIIPEAAERLGTSNDIRDRVLQEARDHLDELDASPTEQVGTWSLGEEGRLRRAVIDAKREAVVRLRDAGEIDDTVLRRFQQRLDVEELRLLDVRAEE